MDEGLGCAHKLITATTKVTSAMSNGTGWPKDLSERLVDVCHLERLFLSCAPSDVDMSSVFSPSFSTVLPSAVQKHFAWALLIMLSCGSGTTFSARLFLQHHCRPPAAVARASTRWPSHITVRLRLNCSAESPPGSAPSCILPCLLTHFHTRRVFSST